MQKYLKINPMAYLLTGMSRLSSKTVTTLKTINHGSMVALTNGTADKSDWDNITTVLNMGVVLSENVFHRAHLQDFKDAQVAHVSCGRRLEKHGKFGYTGPELEIVNHAMNIHDAQLDVSTVGEVEDAHREVYKRLTNGKIDYTVKEKSDERK